MTENRCKRAPGGRFNCGVDGETEAGPSVCKHSRSDAVFPSRCGHHAVGRCMSPRANAEAAGRPQVGRTAKTLYSIGYSQVKRLSSVEGQGEPDKAAIERLWIGRGTAEDLELAAQLFEELGEGANAEHLRGVSR